MGYYSSLSGNVRMTPDAYAKFITQKLNNGFYEDYPVTEYLDVLDYNPDIQVLYLEGAGKMYADEALMDLLARYKDLPWVDTVYYTGEEPGDVGVYYIDIGRWCYITAEIPPAPPVDSDSWQSVDKQEGC
ncbi:hypothetical protein MTAT_19440 [Moorella thermoacetica]|uniref:Uncharacterized protein n=1 Tax=Neomoorella thermoacetica TaxID=1525 RepID=A0AAC9MVG3_NEOTH|nr:hypothetical protein [Moorella thermoacetica]AOQ24601.1 hypothetical protein Maut_02171 [Moorella thermoacetica]TYL12702.1 hypothetical protein MTAT_19440 [Moorella thermoacetica]